MLQVDEGLIHAWIDGQLAPDQAARVAQQVATDPAWAAAAAEARGLSAAATRVLGALDGVPSVHAPGVTRRREPWSVRGTWLRAAAGIVLVIGISVFAWPRTSHDVPSAPRTPPPLSAPRVEPAPKAKTPAPELTATPQAPAALGNRVAGVAASALPPSELRQGQARSEQSVLLSAPVAKQLVDPLLNACWAQTDSAGHVPLDSGLVLRFIAPVASDRVAAAPPSVPLVERGAIAEDKGRARVPMVPMVKNATPAARGDSNFVAQWYDERGTVDALFTIRGDTLMGTMRVIGPTGATGGAAATATVSPPAPLRAVRAVCPR